MKSVLLAGLCLLFLSPLFAQTYPPANLEGQALRTWLKQNWYDGQHNQLGYSNARRAMYAYIENEGDTITCVYSGFFQLNPYGNEITYPNPINTEHTVPQSFFSSSEPMQSDIHHLFPTYGDWNSTRANSPFREIDDPTTTKWMRGNSSQPNTPTSAIDEYSESNIGGGGATYFESREDHKGDLVRAVAYFYTMYPNVGQISDLLDAETLCLWNTMDPPSAKDAERNDEVEQYQGNRNPYSDYPELVERAFPENFMCPEPQDTTMDTTVALLQLELENSVQVSPNPIQDKFMLDLDLGEGGPLEVSIFNAQGSLVQNEIFEAVAGENRFEIRNENLSTGLYLLRIEINKKMHTFKILKQ